jgi:hydroxypyruvate reductase
VALASVGGLGAQDLVLVLVSGGGSALWSAPSGIDLAAKRELISRLLLAGADIDDLNVVRKHLSRIKGGLLARATRARLLTLALSDVPGDDPATIASGPTVPDPSTYAQAVAVLDQFGVASAARSHLADGARGLLVETPKPGDEIEARSQVRVIGSNKTMLDAAAEQWRRQGFPVIVLSDALTGEAHRLARSHADLATALVRGDDASSALAALAPSGQAASVILQAVSAVQAAGRGPVVVLSGGEATVTVTGTGRGGRNQEFALWLHHYLRRSSCDEHVAALVAGSDGVDGNSPAAGAVISATTARRAASLGLSPAAYLRDNDSFSFFERLGDTVVTGPTGTNLNDYRVMLVGPTG